MTPNAHDLAHDPADADADADADLVLQALDSAIQHIGSVSKMAQRLGVRPQQISMWRKRKSVPADFVIPMEEAVEGFVTRYRLRPKTFGNDPAGSRKAADGYLPAHMHPAEVQ